MTAMSRKFIVPLFIMLLIAVAGCIVMAANRHTKAKKPGTPECCTRHSQSDMLIWESLGRTLITIASY